MKSSVTLKTTNLSWTGMGNPLAESDLAGLEEETGYVLDLPEEEFLDLTVTRINGESPLFSLDFVWSGDGKAYTFRLLCPQEELEDADISGMYYDWTATNDTWKVQHCDALNMSYISETEDDVMVTLWYDAAPGLMYSLSAAGNDLNGLDLTVLADQIYIPVQGNAG